ncbi:MAG: LysR family transcriptional regulator [Rhodoferax sp.]
MDDWRWDDMRLLVAVHEGGSLSAAARALGLGQATLSRRMAEFEARLGEPLLVRQPQGVRLSPLGQRLLPAAQRMAEWAAEAAASAARVPSTPQGRVRIAAPPGVAQDFLAPFAAQLLGQHPGLQIDILSGVDVLDLARAQADLSLRTQAPQDGDLIVLDRIEGPARVFAAPAYADTLRADCTLSQLRWVSWTSDWAHLPAPRALASAIDGFAPVLASNDYNVQRSACQAGAGAMVEAAIYHRWALVQQLRCLPFDLGPAAQAQLHLVCHRRLRHLPKVDAVVRAVRAEFDWARQETARRLGAATADA